ncbi:photoreceptor ankyrin repeat protein-like [Heptranchias perlo]|uniref:photoreceptor ankyrin repeat protein-like n=1 Tax=Heptranchias perlo TaxID=212740 RepID=UPI0035599544
MTERRVSLSQRGEKDPDLISGAVCCPDAGLEGPDKMDPDEDNTGDSEISKTSSISSEGSLFPEYERKGGWDPSGVPMVYKACSQNNVNALREMLAAGVTKEEVSEVDINGRNGLMIGCYSGFVGVVNMLDKCLGLDINHQDRDGNTALMMAAQAGHVTIVNYLLNYYNGMDIEMRDTRGFTALMKAAIQGKAECVASLIMAGADVKAVDLHRGKTAQEWALLTGRLETSLRINRLLQRPRVDQVTDSYVPEWPDLKELAEKAMAPKTLGKKISNQLRSMLIVRFPCDLKDNGVLDHMVRMTTSLSSPFIATGCRTICPGSPPAVGKCRGAVPEILKRFSLQKEAEAQPQQIKLSNGTVAPSTQRSSSEEKSGTKQSPSVWSVNARVLLTPAEGCKASFVPTRTHCRNSAVPHGCIPKIELIKASPPTSQREIKQLSKNKNLLPLPTWKYKQMKEDK